MPKEHGGFGILNLEKFAKALRIRWMWHEWKSEDKAWTSIILGDGRKTEFWNSAEIRGCRSRDIAPTIFSMSCKKNRKVWEALQDNNWTACPRAGPPLEPGPRHTAAANNGRHHFLEINCRWTIQGLLGV